MVRSFAALVARSARWLIWVAGLGLAAACAAGGSQAAADRGGAASAAAGGGQTRTYYIAADEVDWNYAPSGRDEAMGTAFTGIEKAYMEHGPDRIGSVYRKAVYREYTDATFKTLKPRPREWEHLGILGPMIHAEVGDTIDVVFKNNATRPYSIHPHGVFYEKNSEGSNYQDNATAADKVGGAVPPGQTHTYIWQVPERAGPGPNDPSSIVWLYHSHTSERRDVNSGLVGTMVITRKGMARPDGTPKDVDREFSTMFMIFDENNSWYLDYNIQHFTGNPKLFEKPAMKAQLNPLDDRGGFDFVAPTGFAGVNLRSTINGLMYGNLPMMTMKQGERVRWYLTTLGFGFNFHTPHWHGNVVMNGGQRTDVIALSPAQMVTVDMVPDAPGTWLYHCHVSEHMEGGMMARYQVLPRN
jgi:FtsP/CotA-like multicopper oxidase with cupredoxin domain